jgi:hypothetical protein
MSRRTAPPHADGGPGDAAREMGVRTVSRRIAATKSPGASSRRRSVCTRPVTSSQRTSYPTQSSHHALWTGGGGGWVARRRTLFTFYDRHETVQ